MRILRAVKAHDTKSARKKPVNLTLSKDAIRYGKALKKPLNRSSLTSVAEFLIIQEAARLGLVKNGEGKAVAA